jgi:hypothetical protein
VPVLAVLGNDDPLPLVIDEEEVDPAVVAAEVRRCFERFVLAQARRLDPAPYGEGLVVADVVSGMRTSHRGVTRQS